MANSIAFSVGSGGGGSIIKSIQRGESPFMKLSVRYSLTSYHPSEPGTSEHYEISSYVSLDPYTVEINQVNPDKSIILLNVPNISSIDNQRTYNDQCGVIIKSFTQTNFQLFIGFDMNYLKNFNTDSDDGIISFYSTQQRSSYFKSINITDNIFPVESGGDITAYLLNIGRNPFTEGLVSHDKHDSDEILTMSSLITVSWQVIEFY